MSAFLGRLLATAIAGLAATPHVHAQDQDLRKFLGYWAPRDEDHWCSTSREEWETEGAQVIIKEKSFFHGPHGECGEVKMWVEKGNLRVAAACRSHEGGAYLPVMELTIGNDGLMSYRTDGKTWEKRKLRRCSDSDLDRADRKAAGK